MQGTTSTSRRLRPAEAGTSLLSTEEHEQRSTVGGAYWQISPDLLGVINHRGHYEKSNPAWERILGWNTVELRGGLYLRIIHPDDREASRAAFRGLKKGAPTLRFENRLRSKEGFYRWFAWSAVPFGKDYFTSGKDITAEKEQQLVLAAASAERDRVWKNSRDIQIVIDAGGILRAVSPAWTSILGQAVSAVIGRKAMDFVWPDDAAAAHVALAAAASSHDLTACEMRHRHEDGTPRWISWNTCLENGLVYGYGRDITALKDGEAQLAAAHEVLRQAQKMDAVGQLTGGLAHDFNNLLAGISGSLELLSDDLAEGVLDHTQRYLEAALGSTKRATSLAQRLLAFARRQTLDARPANMNSVVADMQELIQRTVGPGIRVEIIMADCPWSVLIDANQLENTLLNLCLNARDAMPNGGTLVIETANRWLDHRTAREQELPAGQYVSLTVSDTGTGMTPEVIEHAFEPFFTTKPLGVGTGLGLSMIHGFTRQSGGQVRIYSELGRGSMISLYLPRHPGDLPAPPRGNDSLRGQMQGHGETVLVVDDEADVRMVVTDVLRRIGYESIEAANGLAGLKLLRSKKRIDLLVTDIGLPGGINGRQMAEAARQLRPKLRVLFITGYAENAVMGADPLDDGMQVLAKPFPTGELAARVRDLMNGR